MIERLQSLKTRAWRAPVILAIMSLSLNACDELLTRISQKKELSPFEANWVNTRNVCDSISISKQGDNFLFTKNGKKFPAKMSNELLSVFSEIESKAMISDSGALVFQGSEYSRISPVDTNWLPVGEFQAFNCDQKLRGSIEVDSSQHAKIYAFAYCEVFGKLEPIGENSYSVYFESAYGSISFHRIDGKYLPKANKEKPIARIKVLSENHIQFDWFGISLIDAGEPYLMKTLSDNSLWCQPETYWGRQTNILKKQK